MNTATQLASLDVCDIYTQAKDKAVQIDKKGNRLCFTFEDGSKLRLDYSGVYVELVEDMFNDDIAVKQFEEK